MVKGALKSFPPCKRNPQGVEESVLSNLALKVNKGIAV